MPRCGAHGFSPAAGIVTGWLALVRAGVIHPSAVGLTEGASTGGRVRPQPHAIQLPMAHFLSTLPCPVSLSGWVQGLLTVWLCGWVPCHPPLPAPISVPACPPQHSPHPLLLLTLQPGPASPAPPGCSSRSVQIRGTSSFPISHVLAQDRTHRRAG